MTAIAFAARFENLGTARYPAPADQQEQDVLVEKYEDGMMF